MNTKRLLISIISCFVFVFVYEFVFHGILLKSMYQATIEAWRPESEMMQYMPFAAFSQFWFAPTRAYTQESSSVYLWGYSLALFNLGTFPICRLLFHWL
jgi:hypothetical protein